MNERAYIDGFWLHSDWESSLCPSPPRHHDPNFPPLILFLHDLRPYSNNRTSPSCDTNPQPYPIFTFHRRFPTNPHSSMMARIITSVGDSPRPPRLINMPGQHVYQRLANNNSHSGRIPQRVSRRYKNHQSPRVQPPVCHTLTSPSRLLGSSTSTLYSTSPKKDAQLLHAPKDCVT